METLTVCSLFRPVWFDLISIVLIDGLRETAWSGFKDTSQEVNGPLAFAIARRILAHGPLSKDEYFAACGDREIGHKYLLLSVFAIDSQGMFTFENKMTENSVRCHLPMANAPNSVDTAPSMVKGGREADEGKGQAGW